jgi:hypothetical protein
MDNNKSYFYIVCRQRFSFITGIGYSIPNFNLMNILKDKYNKYNAFNIKLEMHSLRYNGAIDAVHCLHMSGLNWINGYDTMQTLNNSRVIEIIAREGNANTFTYFSNANAISFYRPSTPSVDLVFFFTDINGNYVDVISPILEITYIFSITGIDAYKIHNPSRGLRYDIHNKLSASFFLKYYDGESIDPIDTTATKGRIRLFKNINFRSIIGNEMYNKYRKFALVVKRMFHEIWGNIPYGAGNYWYSFYLSANNIYFDTPPSNVLPSVSVVNSGHFYNQYIIGTSNLKNDCYIEYVFSKPSSDFTDFIISYSVSGGVFLPNSTNTNNNLFPNITFLFEIIPIEN